jgi:hypothetical protein
VLVIVNGHAGAMTPRGIGICHLELKTAMEDCPQKVLLIRVKSKATDTNFANHLAFKQYFDELWSTWRKFGTVAGTADERSARLARSTRPSRAEWPSITVRPP